MGECVPMQNYVVEQAAHTHRLTGAVCSRGLRKGWALALAIRQKNINHNPSCQLSCTHADFLAYQIPWGLSHAS
uniref:Uncharacterized protein n=1 Tax=Physcomitrium patens TaxID=3218 RepID=A0A2K1K2V1_PHYPA|nr:hypothetical protein PHYPA_012578 [Physcomitrium patens]